MPVSSPAFRSSRSSRSNQKRRKRSGILARFAAILALTACATQSVAPTDLARIKTVGIVSAIGDVIILNHVGTTAFTNDEEFNTKVDWGLDAAAVQSAAAKLDGRYEVRSVSYDAAPFAGPPRGFSGLFDKERPLGEIVRDSVRPQGLDAYIVLRRDRQTLPNQDWLEGLGLDDHNFLGIHTDAIYAAYRVAVIDGRSMKVLAEMPATSKEPGDYFSGPGLPMQPVDHSLWGDSLATMSSEQQEKLQEGLRTLVDRSLTTTFRSLHLID